jgi:hypothetical protein
MTDPVSKNVQNIVAYRDGERYIHRLNNAIAVTNARTKKEVNTLRITDIPVVNLAFDSTNELVSNALGMNPRMTMALTTHTVLRKMHGNVYHILRYLEFLQFEQLLAPPTNDGYEHRKL